MLCAWLSCYRSYFLNKQGHIIFMLYKHPQTPTQNDWPDVQQGNTQVSAVKKKIQYLTAYLMVLSDESHMLDNNFCSSFLLHIKSQYNHHHKGKHQHEWWVLSVHEAKEKKGTLDKYLWHFLPHQLICHWNSIIIHFLCYLFIEIIIIISKWL